MNVDWNRLTDAIRTIAKNYEWFVKIGNDDMADWTFDEYNMSEWYNTREAYI